MKCQDFRMGGLGRFKTSSSRHFARLFFLCLVFSVFTILTVQGALAVDISTCADLQNMSNDLSGDYVLTNDIDCSDTINWNGGEGFMPIGEDIVAAGTFKGTFDGGNKTISNLFINRSGEQCQGLFGVLYSWGDGSNQVNVHNVKLENFDITGGSNSGILVGKTYTSTVDVYEISIKDSKLNCSSGNCGAVIGYHSEGVVHDSYTKNVSVKGGQNVGLIGGTGGLSAYNLYSSRSDNYSSSSYGNIIGYLNTGQLNNSFFAGSSNNEMQVSDINESTLYNLAYLNHSENTDSCSRNYTSNKESCDFFYVTTDENYFKGTDVVSSEPMKSWDFTTTWHVVEGDYPTLAWEGLGEFESNLTVISPTNITYNNNLILIDFITSTGTNGFNEDSLWYYNGTGNTTYTTPINITLEPGNYNYIFYANDTSGNLATEYVAFNISDNTAPDITVTSPTNTTYTDSEIVLINFTAVDGFSVDELWFNNETDNITYTTPINVTGLGLGEYNYTFYVNDTSGNLATEYVAFNISDNTAPTAEILTTNNTKFSQLTNEITFNGSDETALANASLYLDGVFDSVSTAVSNGSMTISKTFAASNTTYNVSINVCDTSNNCNMTENRTIYVLYDLPDANNIDNCVELQYMWDNYNPGGDYTLTSNIDCSDTINWNDGKGFIPVGDATDWFRGTLDGQEYTIYDLYINRPSESHVGLFGKGYGWEKGDIKRLVFDNATVHGKDNTGIVVGYTYEEPLIDITVNNSMLITYGDSGGIITGFCEDLENVHVINSEAHFAVGAGSTSHIGFLCGQVRNSDVINSSATGVMYYNGTGEGISGFMGMNDIGTLNINNSYSTVTINVNGNDGVGCLATPKYQNVVVSNSYAKCSVKGNQDVSMVSSQVNANVEIHNSYSLMEVNGSRLSGGVFMGGPDVDVLINNSFFNIKTNTSGNLIGVMGYRVNGDITTNINDFSDNNWWVNESASEPNQAWAINDGSSTNVNSTWVTSNSSFIGTSAVEPFSTWDFTTTWHVVEGDYPRLAWEGLGDFVDMTEPNITITSPTNTTYNVDYVLINFSAVDDFSVDDLWFNNGTGNTTYTTPINVTGLGLGEYNYTFYVNDTSGNLATEYIAFNISDNTAPDITVTSPTNTTYTDSEIVLINFTAVDDFSVDDLWFNNGTDNITYTTPVNVSLYDDQYNYTFYTNDTSGNLATEYVAFNVSAAYLNISLIYPTEPNITVYQDRFFNVTTNVTCLTNYCDLTDVTLYYNNTPVSTVVATTPFYTNNSNPREVNLTGINQQNVVFYVNATGEMTGTSGQSYLDFGGMYGYGLYSNYPNPATGGFSCPAGYTASRFLGSPSVDYNAYFCYRNGTGNPYYDFGGMYGDGLWTSYKNPATGSSSCPAGYTAQKVLSTTNIDFPLRYCYRNHTTEDVFYFGGLTGYSIYGTYDNPATGSGSCPTGYTRKKTYGTTEVDFPAKFCYQDTSLQLPYTFYAGIELNSSVQDNSSEFNVSIGRLPVEGIVDLVSPVNGSIYHNITVNYTATANDTDGLDNASVNIYYSNGTIYNITGRELDGSSSSTFGIPVNMWKNGDFIWNYDVYDILGDKISSENWTITMDLPALNATQINPTTSLNVTQGDTFNVNTSVCCLDYDCGEVNISLDPHSTIWTNIQNVSNNDYAYGVTLDSNNIIVTGDSDNRSDISTFKYDSDGNLLWNDTFDTGNNDSANDISGRNGNYYIAGRTNSGAGDFDFLIVKYNSSGSNLQNLTFGLGANGESFEAIVVDSNNDVIAVGHDGSDIILRKYNSSLSSIWNKTYDAGETEYATGIDIDSNNNIYFSGYVDNGSESSFLAVKYNGSGVPKWNKTLRLSSNTDTAEDIAVDRSNFVIVTGGFNNGTVMNGYTIKYDSDGNKQWDQTYGSANADTFYAVDTTSGQNDVIVSGKSDDDIFTLSYKWDGTFSWSKTYDTSTIDSAKGLAVDSNNDIIVVGYVQSDEFSLADYDFYTVKYDGDLIEKSNLVSTVTDDTPFFTNDLNPYFDNFTENQCKNYSWIVEATGPLGNSYDFFVRAEKTSDNRIYNETIHWNVTIMAPPDEPGGGGGSSGYHTISRELGELWEFVVGDGLCQYSLNESREISEYDCKPDLKNYLLCLKDSDYCFDEEMYNEAVVLLVLIFIAAGLTYIIFSPNNSDKKNKKNKKKSNRSFFTIIGGRK